MIIGHIGPETLKQRLKGRINEATDPNDFFFEDAQKERASRRHHRRKLDEERARDFGQMLSDLKKNNQKAIRCTISPSDISKMLSLGLIANSRNGIKVTKPGVKLLNKAESMGII